MMTFAYCLLAVAIIYLLLGLLVAIVRNMAHDMPWQLFVFTIFFWPSMWSEE